MMDASSNYLLSIPDDVEGFLPYNYRCSFIECCGNRCYYISCFLNIAEHFMIAQECKLRHQDVMHDESH